MKILKRPDNIIFDTANPNKLEHTKDTNPIDLTPLHQFLPGGEWAFLNKHFEGTNGNQHEILKDYGYSYFYVVEQ